MTEAIEWDAESAADADLSRLIEIDDRVEKWVSVCGMALTEVLAECRQTRKPRPPQHELAQQVAKRAFAHLTE